MSAPGNERRSERTRTDWETPQELFALLDREFHFTLDGAASEANAKCERFYSEETDAFKQEPYGEAIFCNPPYGAGLHEWMRLFARWHSEGNTVVALLPANTDTAWFADACWLTKEVRLLKGRVQFKGTTSSNPGGSAVFVWSIHTIPAGPHIWVWDWKFDIKRWGGNP